MNFIVSQVKPKLCYTKEDFIDIIDEKISKIVSEYPSVDLILFPEAIGLWLCVMEPLSKISKFFYKFLPVESLFISSKSFNSELIAVELQFLNLNLEKSSSKNWLIRLSNWIFRQLNLSFISYFLRSLDIFKAYKEAFSKASKKYNVYIQAGSIYEKTIKGTKNVAYTFSPSGDIVCRQEKWHPLDFEGMMGVKRGFNYQTFEIKGIKCGIAICADLNYKNSLVKKLSEAGCKFIAGPSGGIVPSYSWEFNYTRDVLDAQQARANENNVIIGRSYNAGGLLNDLIKFKGRSSIVEPNRLVAIVPEDNILSEYNLYGEIKSPD